MRFGFVTCVQLGLSCIEQIYRLGGKLSIVYTLHDHISVNKSGRVYLDDFCASNNVPLLKLSHINDGQLSTSVRELELDWLFIIGWSQIASDDVLASPTKGVLGMHPSLLPVGRGRASVPWAILKKLEYTGVTMFKLDSGVDTGPILLQEPIKISKHETASSLYRKVQEAHISLMASSWSQLASSTYTLSPQSDALSTYWPRRTPEDGELSLNMLVADVELLVRASTHPYPGAFIRHDSSLIRVWSGGLAPLETSLPLLFSDGVYYAYEYEVEPL